MSPETVLAAADAAIASPFSADAFDACVMQTYGRFPLALERGEGCRVWDTQGRSYLDFVAGIATCTLGHAHPDLVDAISDQIRKLHHVSNLYYIPEQGQLAAWLTANSCADRVFFCNSGAEANEAAIKLARKHGNTVLEAENPIILTAQASFHGRTLAAVTATGQPKYHKGFQPLVQGFRYVPYNDLAALEATLAELDAAGETPAAILLEPLQGEGGVNPGDRAYFQAVRQLCDQRRMLLILDEVQVGMGRSGKLWGYENLGIEPDAFTVAKGLGGGVPIGALLVRESCNILKAGEHASTFGGNPLACRAGLAIAQVIDRDQLLANVQARGEQLRAGLQELVDCYPNLLAGVRGWGLINGLVLRNDPTVTPIAMVKAAIEQGLLLVPAGAEVVRFVPPLIVSAAEIDEALAMAERALLAIAGA